MIAMLGIGAFFLVGLLVSVRLLMLWRRTRQWPELAAALGLLGIGPLGFCVMMTGYVLFHDTPVMPYFRAAGVGIQALGFVATVSFTWRVFRPKERWAAVLMAGLSLALIGTGVAMIVFPVVPGHLPLRFHLDIVLKILAFGWGAYEPLRYWRLARQRVALGVADPLVSASFLMWGITSGAGALGFAIIYMAIASLPPGGHLSSLVYLVISAIGLIGAVSLYLSFLPPQAYRHRVAAHAPASGG
jgi:hypothetical protein